MSFREGKEIPLKTVYVEKEAQIVGMADIHSGDKFFRQDLFESYVDWIKADSNRFAMILGDAYNFYSHWFVPSGMWDQIWTPNEQIRYMERTLYPIRKQILGMVKGNHEIKGLTARTSIDPLGNLCEDWGVEDLGPGGYFCLNVSSETGNYIYKIVPTHTLGGSRRKAYKAIQMVEQVGFDDADIVMLGHQHTMIQLPFTRTRCYWNDTSKRFEYRFHRIDAIRCGTMLEYPDYAVYKGLPAMQLGFPIISLDGSSSSRGVRVDIGENNLRD